jgi:NTE family protein
VQVFTKTTGEAKMDICIALGGGGSRGYAHIGVLRKLEHEGFRVRAIAGTSAGGIIAAAYAAGHTPDEMEEIFSKLDQSKLFTRTVNDGPGLLGLSGATKELEIVFGERKFSDLKMPCAVVAVDIETGDEIDICEGRIVDALLATVAVPGIFPPKSSGEMQLVDGAVLNPVPVSVARMLNPKLPVIAVILEGRENKSEKGLTGIPIPMPVPVQLVQRLTRTRIARAFNIFLQSVDVGSRKLAELRLIVDNPDVVIRPNVGNVGLLDPVDVHKVVRAGEVATEDVLPKLKRAVSWFSIFRRSLFIPREDHDTRFT